MGRLESTVPNQQLGGMFHVQGLDTQQRGNQCRGAKILRVIEIEVFPQSSSLSQLNVIDESSDFQHEL